MNSPYWVLFFEISKLSSTATIFKQLPKKELSFSYFQVDQQYYLFLYPNHLQVNKLEIHSFVCSSIPVIQELSSKKRQLRSLGGFFKYALEIMNSGTQVSDLETNFEPFFWNKVEKVLRQNRKGALMEFLFHSSVSSPTNDGSRLEMLETRVQSLEQELFKLHQKLETLSDASKMPLNDLSLKEVNDTSLSSSKRIQEPLFVDSEVSFRNLRQFTEEEKINMIQTGFQLHQTQKISLKDYYESKKEFSLFQLQGFQMKYETIRRTKLYKQLKEL